MMVAGDVDGDGKADLIVATKRGQIAPLFGNGDGTLRGGSMHSFAEETSIGAIAAGDFDGDGKLDLAIARTSTVPDHWGTAGIALGNGDGTFRWTAGTGSFNRSRPSAVAVADLDGDGKLDLVADIARGTIVVTALGKGDGTLGAIAHHRAAGALAAVADLDGDGKADVVAATGNGVAVSASNGDGSLHAPRAFQVGSWEISFPDGPEASRTRPEALTPRISAEIRTPETEPRRSEAVSARIDVLRRVREAPGAPGKASGRRGQASAASGRAFSSGRRPSGSRRSAPAPPAWTSWRRWRATTPRSTTSPSPRPAPAGRRTRHCRHRPRGRLRRGLPAPPMIPAASGNSRGRRT